MPEPQFIRFIYCYKLNGKPIYVGSAFDVKHRHQAHNNRYDIPFQRFMAKMGRNRFTHEIVEAFRTASIEELWRISVARENHWMDVLNTWHEKGGQNFQRAKLEFDNKTKYRAFRAAQSAAGKRRARDPRWHKVHKAATIKSNKRSAQNPAWQKSVAAARERQAQNPVWRDALLTSHALQRKAHEIGMLPFRVKELRLYLDLEALISPRSNSES